MAKSTKPVVWIIEEDEDLHSDFKADFKSLKLDKKVKFLYFTDLVSANNSGSRPVVAFIDVGALQNVYWMRLFRHITEKYPDTYYVFTSGGGAGYAEDYVMDCLENEIDEDIEVDFDDVWGEQIADILIERGIIKNGK